jgi:hypothetical protein
MNRIVPRAAALVLATLAALGSGACASRYHVDTEAPNFAGIADIKVKINKTDLREMTMHFEHLAPPKRIDPTLRAYVVWIEVPGHGTTKVGLLDYDEEDREADIVATSAYPKFEVLVTLEADPSTATPGSRVVLRKLVGKG